ncbi:MAG: hypothetical protein HZB26_16210 [Candidatus Hydrogenedentes bacterium]|nr:hypothetical protein [Candidatus Hydrogenedentota bacterium]
METKNTCIIAGSIIIASCIIAYSFHRPGEVQSPGKVETPPAAAPAVPSAPAATTPASAKPAVKSSDRLTGKWQEIATWGSLLLSPDGTGEFTSPPNSIRCRWSLPEEGKLKTETEFPKKDAPGIFGDPEKTRIWDYSFPGDDRLVLTFSGKGGNEKLDYMRAPDAK